MSVSVSVSVAETSEEETKPVRSPLAQTTPPPISLATLRAMATKPNAELPPPLLEAMCAQLMAQGRPEAAAEIASLFDLTTGRAKGRPVE